MDLGLHASVFRAVACRGPTEKGVLMEILLAACTVLGGAAALAYFWDKKKPGWFLQTWRSRAPAIPISPSSVFAYANGHPRPIGIVREIAERRGLQVGHIDGQSVWLNEQLEFLNIKTIRELDELVRKHAKAASRLADYITPEHSIDTGFVLARVLELVAIERSGKEGLRRFCTSLKYSSGGTGWADEIYHAFEQIRAYK
jgi:hypothetical protein